MNFVAFRQPVHITPRRYARQAAFCAASSRLVQPSTERPEALDKADFVLAGIDATSLLQAVKTAVNLNNDNGFGISTPDYVDENVSTKVVRLIQSYTGVVDKMVCVKGNDAPAVKSNKIRRFPARFPSVEKRRK